MVVFMHDYLNLNLIIMKTVIVTGGNSGIGLGISKFFHENNYFVIVGGRKDYGLEKNFSKLYF